MIFPPLFTSSASSATAALVTKRHTLSRILRGIAPLQLYQVVCDVNRYQHFLPGCTHSQIIEHVNKMDTDNDDRQQSHQQSQQQFLATLTVGFLAGAPLPPIMSQMASETYTSRVTCRQSDPPKGYYTVHTESTQTTWLDHVQSTWKISPVAAYQESNDQLEQLELPVSCQVDFDVSLSTRHALLAPVLTSTLLQHVSEQQVQAFAAQCRVLQQQQQQQQQQQSSSQSRG